MAEHRLSIIIPVYNEENTILEMLKLVQEEKHQKEIIIVDDASTDGTRELLQQLREQNVRLLLNDVNRGKGYSIRRAIKYVSGDIVIIQDADLEYYPDEYGILIEKITEGKADVVYGTRFLGAHRVFNFYHYLGNLTLNLAANIILDTNLSDLMTCYKAFRKSVIKKLRLEADRFGIETEITAEVFKRRYRVYEVPISYNGRTYEEGKKIKWTDFFRCLYWLFRAVIRGIDVSDDTLLRMRVMKNNNLWTYNKIKPFLKKKILELGSGIGTISRYLITKEREVVLTEIKEDYITYLKERFGGNPRVKVINSDISEIDKLFSTEKFDTIVGINVLEHIEDDVGLLDKMEKIIIPGGKLVLIVPAHNLLFGILDTHLGHYRRYSRKELEEKLKTARFLVEKIEFMDFLGAVGWFVNFKIFKRDKMPSKTMLQLFDKIIPLLIWLEERIKFSFGLSLLCVARKEQ